MSLDDDARAELRALEDAHRLRTPRIVEGRQGPTVIVDGVEVANFASNDYLGLAGDPRLARAAAHSLDADGVGAGASRLLVGNHREHVALESELATWMRCGGVRLFNTGYAANVGVLTTVLRAGDVVFSDELDHASIIDGCRLSRVQVEVIPHRDLAALERALKASAGRRRVVVSESVFSMDGDVADVVALAAICRRHDAVFVLDEAHALGVFGPEGRGVAAAAEVVPDVVIGTLGKALGTFGAFAATSRAVADLLWNRARTLVFSTGMPAAVAAATRAAIAVVRSSEGDERRKAVAARSEQFHDRVVARGRRGGPIAAVVLGDDRQLMGVSAKLLERGSLVAAVRPPTVPEGTSRLRISFSAGHSSAQVGCLSDALQHLRGP